jgi:hypothetical protein
MLGALGLANGGVLSPAAIARHAPMLWIAMRILAATWAPRRWMVRIAGRHTASEHGGVGSGGTKKEA